MDVMDIIAAHQQGLIEKLAEEAAALAGRPKDFGQRAVVLGRLVLPLEVALRVVGSLAVVAAG